MIGRLILNQISFDTEFLFLFFPISCEFAENKPNRNNFVILESRVEF